MYTARLCPYCMLARQLLRRKGAAFKEVSVSWSKKRRAEMERKSGRTTLPQIFINEEHIGGYSDLLALDRTGELNTKLGR